MATKVREHELTEQLLRSMPLETSLSFRNGLFSASCYVGNDVVRGTGCYGTGLTLVEAVEKMLAALATADQSPKIKTARECKDAVVQLIREHEAAPASFREAVDNLNVA